MGEVFKSLVYCDYPEQWPGLLEAVYGHLTSQVCSGLSAAAPPCATGRGGRADAWGCSGSPALPRPAHLSSLT